MSQLSLGKSTFFVVFLILFSVVYYRYLLKVASGESKKIEMLKRLFIILIIIGLINTLTITTDESYKAYLLIIIICLINIYNSRHILKHCPSISPQYRITLYFRSCIVIIILGVLVYKSNQNGIFSFLYSDETVASKTKTDTSSIKLLDVTVPNYCPNMNSNDYQDPNTSDGAKWNALPQDKKDICRKTNDEVNRRSEISNNIYA